MALEGKLHAKEDRRAKRGASVDIPFLILILLLKPTGLMGKQIQEKV